MSACRIKRAYRIRFLSGETMPEIMPAFRTGSATHNDEGFLIVYMTVVIDLAGKVIGRMTHPVSAPPVTETRPPRLHHARRGFAQTSRFATLYGNPANRPALVARIKSQLFQAAE